MLKFYDSDVIPIILGNFKVKKVIFCGLADKKFINTILQYDADFIGIDNYNVVPPFDNFKYINDFPLNSLKMLSNYDAVFINDDANWFTVYNELQLIKKNNDELPLIFICNNKFPNNYYDSYVNPNIIPKEYLHNPIKKIVIKHDEKKIQIPDDIFHSCSECAQNGVNNAIKDFLNENDDVNMLDIPFIENITILYPSSTISQIRIDKIMQKINEHLIIWHKGSEKIIENQLLFDYILENNLDSFNNNQNNLNNIYNNLNFLQNECLDLKNKLDAKDSTILKINEKNQLMEKQLSDECSAYNSLELELKDKNAMLGSLELELDGVRAAYNSLELELKDKNAMLGSLELELDGVRAAYNSLELELKDKNVKINSLKTELNEAKNIQNRLKSILDENEFIISSLKDEHISQSGKLNSKNYLINTFKDEIYNNSVEIQFLKKNMFIKSLFGPLSYIFLIFRSKPNELILNIKLYHVLKNSVCFDIGYYLNNNKDILESKWWKYFPPELHYVCNGFNEHREINKNFFNLSSKKNLLEYLLK